MEYGHGRGSLCPTSVTEAVLPVLSIVTWACFGRFIASAARVTTVLLLTLAVLTACAPRRHAGAPGRAFAQAGAKKELPRAEPAYLQWLERQSMLGTAPQLIAGISGMQVLWRNSAVSRRAPVLLRAAPNWFSVNPHAVSAEQQVFKALTAPDFLDFLSKAGMNGLYVAPSGERGDIWGALRSVASDGDNITSFHFDPVLGDEADFEQLAERLDQLQIQIGGDLPTAATGLGPDFMLQARQAARFDGVYAMVSAPQKKWNLLPTAQSEWDCRPLMPEAATSFAQDGLLPELLTRDLLSWSTPGGWAVTGEVRGTDGQTRRWIYRYSGDVSRPVLLWQAPSGQARRIFSAAVIRHTGMQRQTLTGVKLETLMGLDARQTSSAGKGSLQDAESGIALWNELSPGPEALNDIGRETHRYGGWIVQADVLPPSLTASVLAASVDFTRDTIAAPAAAYALLSADAAPLAALLRVSLAAGVDHSRIARGLNDWQYVDWRPLLDLPTGRNLAQKAQNLSGGSPDGLRRWSTPASVAARALHFDAAQAASPDNVEIMRRTCFSLLAWRTGLPGLVFVSPQDLTGALDLAVPQDGFPASFGAAPLWQANGLSRQGRSQARLLFGALQNQWADDTSFLQSMSRVMRVRQKSGLAEGSLLAVLSGPSGCIAVFSRLPDGRHWLLATNFSAERRLFPVRLPAGVAADVARDVLDHQILPLHGGMLELVLDARQSRHILLGKEGTKSEGATS